MDETEKRVKIAEACGWDCDPEEARSFNSRGQWCKAPVGYPHKYPYEEGDLLSIMMFLPDYLYDLNAIHEAWEDYFGFCSEQWLAAYNHLKQVVATELGEDDLDDPYVLAAAANATAKQRAEAFILALNS